MPLELITEEEVERAKCPACGTEWKLYESYALTEWEEEGISCGLTQRFDKLNRFRCKCGQLLRWIKKLSS